MSKLLLGKFLKYGELTLTIGLVFLILSACTAKANPVSKSGFYFDTVITITLYESSKETQDNLFNSCFALASEYDSLFSKTVEGSDIYRINHSKGASVTVSAETIALLEKAIYYAELSDGAVDPTIGIISSIWDFRDNTDGIIPSSAMIAEGLDHVNYKAINIDHVSQSVTLSDPEAQIDLGFIAKGYIADRLKEYLMAQQVSSAMVNLGGNVVVIGSKPDGSAYRVGIQEPFEASGIAALTVDITNRSVVSSGNYERYFRKDGILYHHILDTATGYPVDNDLSSVTIFSEESVDGDALSTLVFVLGAEKGRLLIESLPDVSAVLITKDKQQITIP